VVEFDAIEVVVGLPRGLSGQLGAAAQAAQQYAVAIAHRVQPVPVRVVDERLSTVTATRSLREAGVKGRRHRPVVDQAAAVVILQFALDAERASGREPGSLVEPGKAPEGPSLR
jgi:putative Holliday junction resolvase